MIRDFFAAWEWNVLNGRSRMIWKLFPYDVMWNVWKARTDRVFGERAKSLYEIIVRIKQTFVLWSCDVDTFKSVDSSQIIHNWETILHM